MSRDRPRTRNVPWQEHRRDERRGFADQYFEEPAQPSGAGPRDAPDLPLERVHLVCPHNAETTKCATCGRPTAHRIEAVLIPEIGLLYKCERHAVALVRVIDR